MPIYEYRRPDGTTFEIQQSFSDETLTQDPETGVKVQRVLHAPAVHFKGKGFYNTDYGTRKRQRETAAAAESSSSLLGGLLEVRLGGILGLLLRLQFFLLGGRLSRVGCEEEREGHREDAGEASKDAKPVAAKS